MVPFDMFYLFVEVIFGGIFVSGVGIAAILFFIGMVGRVSFVSNIMLVIFFLMVFSIGYVGGFAALLVGMFAIFYCFRGLINFITSVVI